MSPSTTNWSPLRPERIPRSTTANCFSPAARSNSDTWVGLVEKAYAQLMSQTGVQTYAPSGNIDSYSALDSGLTNGISAITGQSAVCQGISSSTSTATAQSDLAVLQSSLNSGEGVMLSTTMHSLPGVSSLIADHMYSSPG